MLRRLIGSSHRVSSLAVLATTAFLAVCLVLVPAAFGAGGLTGTYKTRITAEPGYNGTWTLSLSKGGTVTVKDNGKTIATGPFTSTGSTITFLKGEKGPGACPGVGKYEWAMMNGQVTFTKVSDSCRGRETIFKYPYKKG